MASEKMFAAPPVASLRKIMKPVISTDVMGNRNVEVKAVGARAEPAALHLIRYGDPGYSQAVIAAELEEEKIRCMQAEKAARLKQFQEDVKRRVRQINKAKRKQQLQNDITNMERHHNQVRSSLRASDTLTERKDRVVSHTAPPVSLQPSLPSAANSTSGQPELERERQKKIFEKHNRQVHAFTSEAREKLSGRRVEGDNHDADDLPGGLWISHGTRAQSTKVALDGEEVEEAGDIYSDRYQIEDVSQENENSCEAMTTSLGQHGPRGRHTDFFTIPQESDTTTHAYSANDHSEDEEEEAERLGNVNNNEEDEVEEEYKARLQRVTFNLRTVEMRSPEHKTRRRKKASHSIHCPSSAPDLRAGATELAERRRQEQQKLSYRRLYSDLERQAVRDNLRRKQQRQQIQKIKKEKEEVRRQEEETARRLVEARDPVTGETSVESDLRLQMEQSHLQEMMQEREGQRQKQREMARYLDALRNNLREKLSKQRMELPSLCCCGETLWDTHPDTCANNCFYYKNHRAYARALQSLLTSSDIM